MHLPRSVWSRLLLGVAAFFVLFTVVGFLVLPPVVKSQLEKRLSAELGRRVTVGKVRMNPYVLSLTLENFAMQEADGTTLFLGWRRLHVNFDAWSSLRGEWVLGEILLDDFTARGRINPDQSLNVSDVLAKLSSTKDSDQPPRPMRVARLQVTNSRVDLEDRSKTPPFATAIGPLTFALTQFRTVSEEGAPARFDAVTEAGEKLAWSGTLRAGPLRSTGEFSLENIVLPKYAPYYADRIQAEVVAGAVTVRGRYEIEIAKGLKVLRLHEGAVQLRGLVLRERGTEKAAVELPALEVTGIQADALKPQAAIAAIVATGGHLRVRRETDGSLNLLSLLQPATAPPPGPPAGGPPGPPAPGPASAPMPDVTVGEFVLQDFQIEIADLSAPRPVELALSALQLSLKNVTLAEGAALPLQLAFEWAPRGTVRLAGTVGLNPVQADLKLELSGMEILPLGPLLESFAHARLTQGTVSAILDTQVSLPKGQPLAAKVSGEVSLEKFALVSGEHNEELAGFAGVTVRGLRAAMAPDLTLAIEEVDVAAPYARVVRAADLSLNLASIMKRGPALPADPAKRTAAAVPAAPPAAAPQIEVGRIAIADGDFRFTDRSMTPAVGTAINGFGGTLTGLSSANPQKADLALKAMVDGAGPLSITGKVDPLKAKTSVDLKIELKNMDLVPFSPYSGKFAGYELARGKLVVDVKLLMDGKKIDAANVFTLNQLTFGSPVKSPVATKLPVRLGVALLKDADGKIVLEVPVQGSMDDPNFQVGAVVSRVVVNLLTKAATSPFTLLGAAFGGGGDELAFQEFAPGSAALQENELKKLQAMTKALTNRPSLNLELEGSFDAAADTYALRRVKLAENVRRLIWDTKTSADSSLPPPAQRRITPEENVAAIKRLFDEAFPPGTEFGAPVAPAPVVASPPPAPPVGFFRRGYNLITFQGRKSAPTPAQREGAKQKVEHDQAVVAAAKAGLPFDEMCSRLAEKIPVDDNDLRALAQARAEAVRDYLTGIGKISAERLVLAKDRVDPAKAVHRPRVSLHLQ